MDSTTVQRLALAWMRRKKWENRALAAEVVSLLGEAMGGKKPEAGSRGPAKRPGPQKVAPSELMRMMGVPI